MPSQIKSLVLRAPGILGLSTEGEQVQASPEYARTANNIAYDAAGRLSNRKGFSSTSSKYESPLGNNPVTPASANAADDDGIAAAARPTSTFTLISLSDDEPPNTPRYLSATNTAVTVATSAVSTGDDTVTISSHGLSTTNSVTYHHGGGTVLAGLAHETTYFVVKVDASTIKFASSLANASAGTTIDLTGTGNNSQYFTDGDKTVTITGTDVTGTALTETLSLPTTAGAVNGTALFKTVTKAEISSYPVGNVKVGVQASTVLTIAHTAHGRAVGDTVTFSGATATSGIDANIINASHTLTTVATNSYTVTVLDSSTGTTAGGGSVVPTSAVNIGTEVITISSHGLSTGDFILYNHGGSTVLAGLSNDTYYYVIKVNDDTFKLATNHANAYAGTAIDLTGTGNNAQIFSYVTAKFVGLQGYPDIEQLFQYNASGGNKLIATATVSSTRKIFKLDSPYSDFEDITGSTSPSGNDWQFVNFNDKVIGARASNALIAYTGSSNFANISSAVKDLTIATSAVNIDSNTITSSNHGYFTGDMIKYEDSSGTALAGLTDGTVYYVIRVDDNDLKLASTNANAQNGTEIDLTGTGNNSQKLEAVESAGTVPDGNIVHSAFGRLWAQKTDTGTGQNIIAYCALLDETSWSTGAGEINVIGTASAVSTGFDELTAISSFDGYLVAFLRDSIVIYDSPEAPGSLAIEQIIQGIGCIARDSVQQVGDDVYFLSDSGIRSLKQVVFTANRVEMKEVTKIVRRDLVDSMNSPTGNLAKIRTTYNPKEGQYWIKAPSGDIWVVNNHSLQEEDTLRITKFVDTDWYSFVYFEGDTFLASNGCIGKYDGYNDIDTTSSPPSSKTYSCVWQSNYADFDTSKLKILKNVGIQVLGASGQQITLDWDFDQGAQVGSRQLTIPGAGNLAEWGEAEWNIAEWAGSISLDKLRTSASRMGRAVSLGISFASDGNAVSVEQLSLFAKLGREDK